MTEWVESLSEWRGRLPAALVCTGLTTEHRRALPHTLAARALGRDPDEVLVTQSRGHPPAVTRPAGAGLFLSIASRGPFTAAAVAASQVGIDVECVDPDGEIPWNVLHPDEVATLVSQEAHGRAVAFARLWSVKEAYLKALGVGLAREPSSFAVRMASDTTAVFDDPLASQQVAAAETTWRACGAIRAAVSLVTVERQRDAG